MNQKKPPERICFDEPFEELETDVERNIARSFFELGFLSGVKAHDRTVKLNRIIAVLIGAVVATVWTVGMHFLLP